MFVNEMRYLSLFVFHKMINEILKSIRVTHNIEISELAEKLDLYPNIIFAIENNEINPSDYILEKYSRFFHLPQYSLSFFKNTRKNTSLEKIRLRVAKLLYKRIKSINEK